MKKGFYAILTALAVLALVMTGCSNSTTPGGGPTVTPSTDTSLGGIDIEEGESDVTLGSASSPEDIEVDQYPINVYSTASGKEVEVTLIYGRLFQGTAVLVKIDKNAEISADDFNSSSAKPYNVNNKPKFEFSDGDKLYVRMTAGDGVTVKYYGGTILMGADASLRTVEFVDADTTLPVSGVKIDMGEPRDSLTAFPVGSEGKIQFNTSGSAFEVSPKANDGGAEVEISLDGTFSDGYSVGDEITFDDSADTYLYIHITSYNGSNELYYKLKVILLRSVAIPYGTPPSIDASTYDTWWDDENHATAWLDINRLNTTETGHEAFENVPLTERTFGRAKLAWDADGMYIYAQVWEKNITEIAESGTNNHLVSSVELFICETAATTGTVAASPNSNGGQYRLGANNVRSGPQANQTEAFNGLNRSDAKAWKSGDFPFEKPEGSPSTLTNGYVVVFQAPWLFITPQQLTTDHKDITLELQINAIGLEAGDSRIGVLNWNNASSNSYQEVNNFGKATLELNGNTLGAMGANITTQPKSQSIKVGADTAINALTVVAASRDGGTLTYQWYSAASATAVGTAIGGATNASYTPTINKDTVGTYYYYVVVTNKNASNATSTRKSNVAIITVYEPVVASGDVELLSREVTKPVAAAYQDQFSVPLPVDLADYKKIEFYFSIAGVTDLPDPNDADFFLEIYSSDGSRIFVPNSEGGYNNTGTNYNADAVLLDDSGDYGGLSYNITPSRAAAIGGGTAKLLFRNKGGNTGKNLTISSVQLVNEDGVGFEILPPQPVEGTVAAAYQDQFSVPFAVDLAAYKEIQIWYYVDGRAAEDAPTGAFDNDFFIVIYGSNGQEINIPDSEGGNAGSGVDYNAGGILLDDDGDYGGAFYNIGTTRATAIGGGSAKILFKNKNGSIAGKDITIMSVKLILKD